MQEKVKVDNYKPQLSMKFDDDKKKSCYKSCTKIKNQRKGEVNHETKERKGNIGIGVINKRRQLCPH